MAASSRDCGKCCPGLETHWCNEAKIECNQHCIACYAKSVSDVFLLYSLRLHGQSPFVLCSVCSCILFSGVFNLFFKGWLLSLTVKIHHSVSVICFFCGHSVFPYATRTFTTKDWIYHQFKEVIHDFFCCVSKEQYLCTNICAVSC